MTRCTSEGCTRESYASELCSRHYQQKRRGKLGKTRRITAPGESGTMNFAIDRDAKIALRLTSKNAKISASEFVRRAVEAAIKPALDAVRAKRDSRRSTSQK